MNDKHEEKPDSIVVRQTYPVPPEAVFRLFSDPELFRQWWGHGPWAATEVQIDLKVQGPFRYVLHNPEESKTFTAVGSFKEIIENKKLVFSWEWLEGQYQGRQTLVTVEFCRTHAIANLASGTPSLSARGCSFSRKPKNSSACGLSSLILKFRAARLPAGASSPR